VNIINTENSDTVKIRFITLFNSQHNTSVGFVIENDTFFQWQIKKAKRVLCGHSNCDCGVADYQQNGFTLTKEENNEHIIWKLYKTEEESTGQT
jgi:hypothetical protein